MRILLTFTIFSALIILGGCGGVNEEAAESSPETVETPPRRVLPDYDKDQVIDPITGQPVAPQTLVQPEAAVAVAPPPAESPVEPLSIEAEAPTPTVSIRPLSEQKRQSTYAALIDLFSRGVAHPLAPRAWRVTGLAPYGSVHQAVRAGDLYAVIDRVEGGATLDARDESGRTPFLVAVEENESYIMDALLTRGAQVDEVDLLGNSAMHLAARSSHIYTLETLQQRGAWIEARNQANYTPLHVAAETGELFAVQHLLKMGADMQSMADPAVLSIPAVLAAKAEQWDVTAYFRSRNQHLGIHMMVGLGDRRGVTELLDDLPFLANHPNATSQSTPLMAAVTTGRCDMIGLLVERGADKDIANLEGNTAMGLALHLGHLDCARELLAQGDTVNRLTTTGMERTLLNKAVARGDQDVVAFILEQGGDANLTDSSGRSALHVAVEGEAIAPLRRLLEHGADPNGRNADGWSPFLLAARHGKTPFLEAMIERGADLGSSSPAGETALHLAAAGGHLGAVDRLLSAGADVSAADHRMATALHRAAAAGHGATAARLIDGGAFLEAADNEACTPLLLAVIGGHQQTVGDLMARGAERNVRAHRGRDGLHLALEHGHIGLARFLHTQGLPLNGQDDAGRSLLFPAATTGSVEVLTWLVTSGLDPNQADGNGISPLHLAVQGGSVSAVRYLLGVSKEPAREDDEGRSPMHLAAARGNTMIIESLANGGVPVDGADHQQIRPLHLAATEGHTAALRQLWMRGADLDAATHGGDRALHLAAREGEGDAIRQLLSSGASLCVENAKGETPRDLLDARLVQLEQAGGPDRPEKASVLLHARAYLDAAITERYRAASCHGEVEPLNALLAAYPEFATTETLGRAPIHWAATYGQVACLRELHARGIRLDQSEHSGARLRPLHRAIEGHHLEAVAWLLEAGASPDGADASGKTARAYAEASGLPELIALFEPVATPDE